MSRLPHEDCRHGLLSSAVMLHKSNISNGGGTCICRNTYRLPNRWLTYRCYPLYWYYSLLHSYTAVFIVSWRQKKRPCSRLLILMSARVVTLAVTEHEFTNQWTIRKAGYICNVHYELITFSWKAFLHQFEVSSTVSQGMSWSGIRLRTTRDTGKHDRDQQYV